MQIQSNRAFRMSAIYPAEHVTYDERLGLCLREQVQVESMSLLTCHQFANNGQEHYAAFWFFTLRMLGHRFEFALRRLTKWGGTQQSLSVQNSIYLKTAMGWADVGCMDEIENILRRLESSLTYFQAAAEGVEVEYTISIDKAEQGIKRQASSTDVLREVSLSGELVNWLNNVCD
ncbi:hypothetical protein C9975_03040 [Thalassospira xiamenensis]|nr:hypothetical protein C9975_03040 [Thalassospira xiamenensis]